MASASASSLTADTPFPSGAWTLYFHAPDDTNWTPDSYKKLGTFRTFAELWGAFNMIKGDHFLSGMFFLMRDPYPPMWENRTNIHGGTYCIKVPEAYSHETYHRYAAAAVLDSAVTDTKNTIVGVSISPKKGFHILKIWNSSCKAFHTPSELLLLGETMRPTDILYRPHVDQKF